MMNKTDYIALPACLSLVIQTKSVDPGLMDLYK